jgi:hypothetical protein
MISFWISVVPPKIGQTCPVSDDQRPVLIPSRWCGPGRTLKPVSVLDQWPDEVLGHPT